MEGESSTWHVLHGEGDPDLREATAARLTDNPRIELRTETSAEAVLDALTEDDVDCVLLGSTLDDGDWRDAVEAVRERDADLPIVLYPEDADGAVASDALGAGVTDYLPRSHEDGELLERIGDAVAERERHRALQDRSNRYEQIMGTLPLSLYFKDEDARFVDVSDKMLADLNVDPIGKTDADLFGDPEDPTGLETYRDDVHVIEAGDPIVGKEERHNVREGNIWMRTSKFPWLDGGEVRGLMGTSRNITGQKSRERELREKSQRLEQFASFVSHDLRNPVNIAQGYLDRARETGDEAAFDEVADALDRMETLIDDLLTTVRQGEDTEEWIDFSPFVDRVWTATDTDAANLVVEIPEGTTIGAVGGQLRQLLNNLFRNASDHGGDDVTITVGLMEAGFFVEDDGPGIDPEDREAVFEYGHTDGGTGIGLTIVSEIAASHGWDVDLTESADGGARFEFSNCLIRQEEYRTVTEAGELPIDETAEIGGPERRGHLERRDDDRSWAVTGGGNDIWGDVEEHFFAYGTVDGNVRIEAQVTDLEAVHEYSKAGVMVRDWPGEGSAFAYVGGTLAHGVESIRRPFPSEDITTETFEDEAAVPLWYRLDWIDNTVVASTSVDGEEWTTCTRYPIAGRDPLSVGLAVCSHDPERTCRAVFEDVRVVQLAPDGPTD